MFSPEAKFWSLRPHFKIQIKNFNSSHGDGGMMLLCGVQLLKESMSDWD